MMWSMLAQLQTWFGNEQWKSYGIQVNNWKHIVTKKSKYLYSDFTSGCTDFLVHRGIFVVSQLMPLTPASELRDSGTWLAEMLPSFTASCFGDKSKGQFCIVLCLFVDE